MQESQEEPKQLAPLSPAYLAEVLGAAPFPYGLEGAGRGLQPDEATGAANEAFYGDSPGVIA